MSTLGLFPRRCLTCGLKDECLFFDADISPDDNSIIVNGKTVKCVSDRNPLNLPWDSWGVDLVIEATGVFRDKDGAGKHIAAGAKNVCAVLHLFFSFKV